MIQQFLEKIPKTWFVAGAISLGLALAGTGIYTVSQYNKNIKNVVIEKCNTIQLEEELENEKRKTADALARMATLERLLAEAEAEVVEVEVFRDRVVTEIREVQVEAQSTPEGKIREEVSPTTRAFLNQLKENTDEE